MSQRGNWIAVISLIAILTFITRSIGYYDHVSGSWVSPHPHVTCGDPNKVFVGEPGTGTCRVPEPANPSDPADPANCAYEWQLAWDAVPGANIPGGGPEVNRRQVWLETHAPQCATNN